MGKKALIIVRFIGIFEIIISLPILVDTFRAIFFEKNIGEFGGLPQVILFPFGMLFLISGVLILRLIAEGRIISLVIAGFIYLISFVLIIRQKPFSFISLSIGVAMNIIPFVIICLLSLPKVKELFKHD